MKSTLKKAGALSALGIVALGVMSVSAMGMGGMTGMMGGSLTPDEIATRQGVMFQEQATLIGATTDEVTSAWAEGKDFKTLAKEKGVTEAQLQAKLQAGCA